MHLCWLDGRTEMSMFDTKMLKNGSGFWFSKPNMGSKSDAERIIEMLG